MGEVQIASSTAEQPRARGEARESIEIGARERTGGTQPRFTLHRRPLHDPAPRRVDDLTKRMLCLGPRAGHSILILNLTLF